LFYNCCFLSLVSGQCATPLALQFHEDYLISITIITRLCYLHSACI